MILVRVSIGLESKADDGLQWAIRRQRERVRREAAVAWALRTLPGFRMLDATGGYAGRTEPCIVFETCGPDGPDVYRGAVAELASELGQESIGLEWHALDGLEFVSPAVRTEAGAR